MSPNAPTDPLPAAAPRPPEVLDPLARRTRDLDLLSSLLTAGFLGMIDALIIILFTFLPLIIIGGAAYGVYRWKKNKNAVLSPAPPQQEKKP